MSGSSDGDKGEIIIKYLDKASNLFIIEQTGVGPWAPRSDNGKALANSELLNPVESACDRDGAISITRVNENSVFSEELLVDPIAGSIVIYIVRSNGVIAHGPVVGVVSDVQRLLDVGVSCEGKGSYGVRARGDTSVGR